MSDSTAQLSDRRTTTRRRWHPRVGLARSWRGFAPHCGHSGELGLVGYQEPTWAMCRAIAETVLGRDSHAIAHI